MATVDPIQPPVPRDAPPEAGTSDAAALACPLCRYDLRGLADPRCPECGFAFTWAELLDERRGRHRYLFEHAGRPWSRPTRALGLTLWRAAVWPWRFWRDVSPTNPVRVRRLVLYWALLNAPLVGLTAVAAVANVVGTGMSNAAARARWHPAPGLSGRMAIGSWTGTISRPELDAEYPPWRAELADVVRYRVAYQQGPVLAVAVVALAWPWLIAAALLLFQASLRRAKVSAAHVLRTAVYGGTVGLSAVVVAVALYGPGAITRPMVDGPWMPPAAQRAMPRCVTAPGLLDGRWAALGDVGGRHGTRGVPALVLVVVPFAAVTAARLAVAYRRYMRFDRPAATVAAAEAVAGLVAVVAILNAAGPGW